MIVCKIPNNDEEISEEARLIDSESTQSTKSSNIHDSKHSKHKHQGDLSHKPAISSVTKQSKCHQHHRKKEHANPTVSKSPVPPVKELTIDIIKD